MKTTHLVSLILTIFLFNQISLAQFSSTVASPSDAKLNRQRGLDMLSEIKSVLKEHYYDKKFRGIDLGERFKVAAEQIKTLDMNSQIFRVIAQLVLEFNDSHTRFVPPGRAFRVEYGFTMQVIGARCFVTDVTKGSDAEAQGLKVGDVVLRVGNFVPTRDNLWKLNYIIYALDPQETLKLSVSNSDRKQREIVIRAKFKSIAEREKEEEKRRKEKKENPYTCKPVGTVAIACKLKTFSVEKKYIDRMMKEIGDSQKLILDLRGNNGGYVKIEEYLTGYFFDRNIKIADFIIRDKIKERIAKSQKEKSYSGELIVLIDSNSASASEVFARIIQIENRGKIVGDVSAGAVMTSISMGIANTRGTSEAYTYSVFGLSVTVADLIMSDGKRLENSGVIPDHAVGPTGLALFAKTDPVLAYAASLLGVKISAEDAGEFYFITKKSEDEDDDDSDGDGGN